MPRKVDPRWGEDGFSDVEPFRLSAGQVSALASMLGLQWPSEKANRLGADLEAIGTQYRNWHRRGPSAFTRAEACRALRALLQAPRLDYAALATLNERALHSVHDALLGMKLSLGPGESLSTALMADRIEEGTLREAVRAATDRLEATKGPERDGEIAWAVGELCRLYEALTGTHATHSNKGKDLTYEAEPQSDAGRFAKACMACLDPELRDSQVNRGLRHYIESKRRPARPR